MTSPTSCATDTKTATNGRKQRIRTGTPVSIQGKCSLTGELKLPDAYETPTARKARQVLAVLLTQANRLVSKEKLAKELWDDIPPTSASTTLMTYIGGIRRYLGDDARPAEEQILSSHYGGYALRVQPEQVDALHYLATVKNIRKYGAESEEELRELLRALDAAAALIQGDALEDVECGPILDSWLREFNETRRYMKGLWVRSALELRLFPEVVDRLMPRPLEHTLAHPLQEDFAKWCMLALYGSSRTADALLLYQQLRKVMRQYFERDPGPNTRQLYSKIATDSREPIDNPLPFI